MIYVTQAHYIEHYKIHVKFNNHKEGIVDLKKMITEDHRPIIKELRFEKVYPFYRAGRYSCLGKWLRFGA